MTELDNSWERLSEDQSVQRDDGGRFAGGRMSTERAREIGEKGGKSVPHRIREKAENLGDALVAALIPTDDMSPDAQAKRLLLHELAEAAARDGSMSVRAIEIALRVTGTTGPETTWDEHSGKPCPTCLRGPQTPLVISDEGAANLRALLADARATGILPASPDASLLERISRAWVLGDVQAMDQGYSELRQSVGG